MQAEHLFEAQQLTPELIESIFQLADQLEMQQERCLENKIMASLFYEPSTRTRLSFETAMYKLGGNVVGTENAGTFSSAIKGESLEDSVRVIGRYVDIIVLRYFEKGTKERLADISPVPIINAGDGAGQHPTQALLDLYTIFRELKRVENLDVVAVGDLKHGRTIRSLVYLLAKYKDIRLTFISPPELKMEEDVKEYLKEHQVPFSESDDLSSAMKTADVVYQTRIQKERFEHEADFERLRGKFVITKELADSMKADAIIMHPLPRNEEIEVAVDDSSHARYFQQAYYGMIIRMALLKLFLV